MIEAFRDFAATKDFLVCIDSDGCMLDNMELKHKECFCPATINVWGLQGVSRYVREVAEFVNLYSRTRGTNRFPAIVRTLELAHSRPELECRGYQLPDLSPLKDWISSTPALSVSALNSHIATLSSVPPVLETAARWSCEVDQNIQRIVRNIRPFPYVQEAIVRLGEFADIVVVSATPHEALVRELTECGIADLVSFIAGQEMGTKAQCIQAAMEGRYAPQRVLKIGDAPSDGAAARQCGVLFNPIVSGREMESWRGILEKSADYFQQGTFGGTYMEGLMKDFYDALPETAPW